MLVFLHFPFADAKTAQHFLKTQSKSHTGEGNGNPLQYSCLKKSMDEGAC